MGRVELTVWGGDRNAIRVGGVIELKHGHLGKWEREAWQAGLASICPCAG